MVKVHDALPLASAFFFSSPAASLRVFDGVSYVIVQSAFGAVWTETVAFALRATGLVTVILTVVAADVWNAAAVAAGPFAAAVAWLVVPGFAVGSASSPELVVSSPELHAMRRAAAAPKPITHRALVNISQPSPIATITVEMPTEPRRNSERLFYSWRGNRWLNHWLWSWAVLPPKGSWQ